MNCVGHLKTILVFIAKTYPAEPLERKLSAVSEGKGVQSVARLIMMESGMVETCIKSL